MRLTFPGVGNLTVKVARYSFSGSIPLKFERKLRRQKQSFGKIAPTVVLDQCFQNQLSAVASDDNFLICDAYFPLGKLYDK